MDIISLGDTARDKITGFTGVVTNINEYMYNERRFGLSPKELHNGKPVESESFDEIYLELVEEETIPFNTLLESKFKFLDEVEDTVTGYSGKVVGITFFLSGCTRIGIQSKNLKDGKPSDWVWLAEDQLKLVNPTKVKEEPVKRGGPMPECKLR